MAEEVSGLFVPSLSKGRFCTPQQVLDDGEDKKKEGGGGTVWEIDKDFLCPICIQMMREAFITPCGHSFCYGCIKTHLESKNNCPSCSLHLSIDQLAPNFLLAKLLKKTSMCQVVSKSSLTEQLRVALHQGTELTVKELDSMLSLLLEKRRKVKEEEAEANMEIIVDFLHLLRQQKQCELKKVQEDLQFIKGDMAIVEQQRQKLLATMEQFSHSLRLGLHMNGQDVMEAENNAINAGCLVLSEQIGARRGIACDENTENPSSDVNQGSLKVNISDSQNLLPSIGGSTPARKKRILVQYDDLQECYLQKRRQTVDSRRQIYPETCEQIQCDGVTSNQAEGLESFKNVLNAFTRYRQLRVVAEVCLGDLFHSSNIVLSIEFDRDDEMFATAGVSKRIKIFEFATIVNEVANLHYPVAEMPARWKLSSLSWNKCTKSQIASSDYEGTVTVWDVNTRQSIMEYEEHENRAWCVDFSWIDPSMLVSGSDDGKVKIWCTKQETSALTIDINANVCSVKYNPSSSNFIAVGSADHHIYYYDMRKVSAPLYSLSGHRKTVSYVKFISSNELASASTDSTLRVWDLNKHSLVQTLQGHTNKKNFVGLGVSGDFLACGSETNEVFVYQKEISKPLVSNRFGSHPDESDADDEDTTHFVSAVCWKRHSPTLLAANSEGTIRVLVLAP